MKALSHFYMKIWYAVLFFAMPVVAQTTWQSELVKVDDAGRIAYHKDADGFVIPDFSFAGYKSGEAIPDYRPSSDRTEIVTPIPDANNTANIQQAINKIAALTPDANGFRGVVQLNAGKYLVDETINLNVSGVVLRGAGCGPDKSTDALTENDLQNMTVIYRRGTGDGLATNVVVMGPANASSATWGANTSNETNKVNITTAKVMPGDFSFEVQSASGYSVGDAVCIKYPSTEAFLAAIWYGGNSNWVNGGDVGSKWTTSNINIFYHRYITKIEGNRITVDAPIFYCLDKQYSQAYIHKITTGTIYTNIGIENLRISMDRTPTSITTTPDQNCVKMNALENCWAKGLHLSDFIHSGIKTEAVTRSTIENCRAVDCSGYVTGSNQYNFENYSRSQLILFRDCFGRNGRHHWISNGTSSVSGIVVLNFTSTLSAASSEGHRYFSQGLLIDGWKEIGTYNNNTQKIGFFLRDNMGTNHGWGAIFSVMWNCNVQNGAVYLDKVPTGQNYSIGSTALTVRKYRNSDAKYTTGYNEGQNKPGLYPQSLYEAQLYARKTHSISIIEQPKSLTTCENTAIYLSVTIQSTNGNAVSYQWKKDGTPIEKATDQTLLMSHASVSDAGFYTVEILYGGGSLESEMAEVNIIKQLPELQFFDLPEMIEKRKVYRISVGDMTLFENVSAYQWEYTGTGIVFIDPSANPVEFYANSNATDGNMRVNVHHSCGVKSLERSISISDITGYHDLKSEHIIIYPNPVNETVYIQNIRDVNHIKIINAAGQTVYSRALTDNCSELVLSVSDYPTGAYVICFRFDSGQEKTYKTIINR